MQYSVYVILFVMAVVAALVFTPLAKKIALRLDAVDYPNARRVNTVPIPRMGGIALFLALALPIGLYYLTHHVFGVEEGYRVNAHLDVNYPLLACAFIIIFVTGLIDDKRALPAKIKFLLQIVAACVAAASGLIIGRIAHPLHMSAFISLSWMTYPVTVIYLVSYVNIINLIDGLDGLAAGVSAIASLTNFILAAQAGRIDAAILSLVTTGACLGFLRYNFHPAKIFMGDSGSLLLGFALGTSSLLSVTRIAGLTTLIVPLVIAAVPILDTLSAIVRRFRGHVSVGQPDKGHLHHRLLSEGFNQRQAVLVIYSWTAMLCVGSFVMTQVNTIQRIVIFLILFSASFGFARHLHLFDPVLLHYCDPESGKDTIVSERDPEFEKAKELIRAESRKIRVVRVIKVAKYNNHAHIRRTSKQTPRDK